jgi:NAD-dependent SIR2 family protein deacetylase
MNWLPQELTKLNNDWMSKGLYISAIAGTGVAGYMFGKNREKKYLFDDLKNKLNPGSEASIGTTFTNKQEVEDFVDEFIKEHNQPNFMDSFISRLYKNGAVDDLSYI